MTKRFRADGTILAAFILSCGATAQTAVIPRTLVEGYPGQIQAKIETRDRFARSLRDNSGAVTPYYLFRSLSRWVPGQTVRIAFRGGNSALYRDIADTAGDWLEHGGLNLDFGFNAATGTYREWSLADSTFSAEIRISFDQAGFWSLVGNDSDSPAIVAPNQPSMNLQFFNVQRPADWKAVVRHEFGHAFGFEHEHQNPVGGCDADFRWYDDPGYVPTTRSTVDGLEYVKDSSGKRPGLYTWFAGSPNGWPVSKVDFNLRQLKDSSAYMTGGFDDKSIMKYFFDASMFVEGTSSHCYSSENLILSDGDKAGFSRFYPADPAAVLSLSRERRDLIDGLQNINRLAPALADQYRALSQTLHAIR